MFIGLSVTCFLLIAAEEAISFKFISPNTQITGRIRSNHIDVYSNSKHVPRTFLQMASRDMPPELTKTSIDAPTMNSRKITASIIVNSPIDDVWSIITDYDHLAIHVPNLVKSYVIPPDGTSASLAMNRGPIISTASMAKSNQNKNVRIFQEGAQKIVGFDFRASLTMDMREEEESEGRALKEKKLTFKLAESSMFSSFDGTWSIRYHSRVKEFDTGVNDFVYRYKTLLTYSVLVKPKGPVPVIALEWRIKEDVPINLIAMKVASEKVTMEQRLRSRPVIAEPEKLRTEWGADETLGMYIRSSNLKVKKPSSEWDAKSPSMVGSNAAIYSSSVEEDTTLLSKRLSSVLNSISAARQSSIAR